MKLNRMDGAMSSSKSDSNATHDPPRDNEPVSTDSNVSNASSDHEIDRYSYTIHYTGFIDVTNVFRSYK